VNDAMNVHQSFIDDEDYLDEPLHGWHINLATEMIDNNLDHVTRRARCVQNSPESLSVLVFI
jgi:hypothetical protein